MKKILITLALVALPVFGFIGATLIPPMTAHADTGVATSSGFDLAGLLATIGTVGIGIGMMLGGVAAVLHALAARTRNATIETVAKDVDAAHEKLDEVRGWFTELAPILSQLAPKAETPAGGAK